MRVRARRGRVLVPNLRADRRPLASGSPRDPVDRDAVSVVRPSASRGPTTTSAVSARISRT